MSSFRGERGSFLKKALLEEKRGARFSAMEKGRARSRSDPCRANFHMWDKSMSFQRRIFSMVFSKVKVINELAYSGGTGLSAGIGCVILGEFFGVALTGNR